MNDKDEDDDNEDDKDNGETIKGQQISEANFH